MNKYPLHPCLFCNKIIGGRTKFCSRKCYHESGFHSDFMKHNPNSGQFKKGQFVKEKIRKECKKCKKEFFVWPSWGGINFCSRLCAITSKERNEKLSLSLSGKKKSPEHVKRVAEAIIRHYDRIGRKTHRRSHHQSDKKYKEWRKNVFERDNYTCQNCGERGGEKQVHHVKSWSKHPELRYDILNGITLCVPCHRKTDTYGVKLKK